MNNQEFYEYKEDESVRRVNLERLMREAAKSWKKIIAFGLIIGILLGGFKMFNEYRNRASMQTKYDAYVVQQQAYTNSVASISTQIATAQAKITSRQTYAAESIKMQLDPFHSPAAIAYLNVNVPEMTPGEEGVDTNAVQKRNAIHRTFYDELIYGSGLTEIAQKYGINTEYFTELISPWYDSSGNAFRIMVRHTDLNTASAILDDLLVYVQQRVDDYQSAFGPFSISLAGKSADTIVDTELATYQSSKVSELSSLQSTMNSLQSGLATLQAPATVEQYGKKTLLKAGIKFGVIGTAGGMVMAFVCLMLMILAKGKILDAEEINAMYALRNLISFAPGKKKRLNEDVDFALAQIENVTRGTKIQKIAVVGSLSQQKLDKLTDIFVEKANASGASLSFRAVAGIDGSARALRALQDCDAFVLVEEFGKSEYKLVRREVRLLSETGKEILGTVYF